MPPKLDRRAALRAPKLAYQLHREKLPKLDDGSRGWRPHAVGHLVAAVDGRRLFGTALTRGANDLPSFP